MEYRTLGRSNLSLSAIAFGSWAIGGWMWGKSDRYEAIGAIKAAYDLGVTSIDTAPIYGQGVSEEIVGEAIKGIPRDRVQILTKFGMRWDIAKGDFAFKSKDSHGNGIDIYRYAGRESIIRECEDSLRRIGTDYIDLYQIHWPDSTTAVCESFEAVARLIESGKVRYAGVCNFSAALVDEAARTVPIVSDQVPFSMVNRGIEDEILPYCMANDVSILAYSPMERGLLTGKIKPGHVFEEGDHRRSNQFFTDDSIKRTNVFLDKLRPLAKDKGVSLSQLVLRWTIDRPGITVALAGARNVEQAVQNALAVDVHFSEDELAFINGLVRAL